METIPNTCTGIKSNLNFNTTVKLFVGNLLNMLVNNVTRPIKYVYVPMTYTYTLKPLAF